MFVTIPAIEENDDWTFRKRGVEAKDPPPEKYSLEWYVLEAEKKQREEAMREDAAAEEAKSKRGGGRSSPQRASGLSPSKSAAKMSDMGSPGQQMGGEGSRSMPTLG